MRGRRSRGSYPGAIRTFSHEPPIERGQSSIYTPLFVDATDIQRLKPKVDKPPMFPAPEASNPVLPKEELKSPEPAIEVPVPPVQQPVRYEEEHPGKQQDWKGRRGKEKVVWRKKQTDPNAAGT